MDLIHDFIFRSAERTPDAPALRYGRAQLSYAELAAQVLRAADGLLALGMGRRERIAVYLEKRIETVASLFGAAAGGGVFVPVNPLLKAEQVAYILADCNVRILVTSTERLKLLMPVLDRCRDLQTVVVTDMPAPLPPVPGLQLVPWQSAMTGSQGHVPHAAIDADMAAILYTSGSTGMPKGVILSHRNMVAGARSVASYLENRPEDRILSVLPLSFDYGLSQLTTAFHAGACVVLLNYLLPKDVLNAVVAEGITGLAAVPPLWMQLSHLSWPEQTSLRYITNSGGAMLRPTLDRLRCALPGASVYLMYGLTEAFRSTFLPPGELERRPDSIGKAIPNAEILVLREDGSRCAVGEPGELVHRGVLVSMGYWNDPGKTAERFKPIPPEQSGLPIAELAVWSGDSVRQDADGFLYFIGRRDEMIKTSGYRVSPTEVEEVVYASGLVREAAAVGIPHPELGQAIAVIATAHEGRRLEPEALLAVCRQKLPAFMIPSRVELRPDALPRNPNGKIDRKALAEQLRARTGEPGL